MDKQVEKQINNKIVVVAFRAHEVFYAVPGLLA